MRAASLLGVFLAAKLCALAGRPIPLSPWTPIAYIWQDLVVVLLFGVLDACWRRPRAGWFLYAGVSLFAAVNVPVERTLFTPLTWPLLRAARGPLLDSIVSYVDWLNVLLMLVVLATAVVLPFALRKIRPRRLALIGLAVLPPLVVCGPAATNRVETLGLHRNVLMALLATALPRISAEALTGDWRMSPFPGEAPSQDLSRWEGIAAGRNVVLVGLESTAARYLRPYGAAEDPMPNLTRLARHALVCDNAYAVYPESIKGLFSVLCSTAPAVDTSPADYERLRCPALAEILSRAGYRTGLFHSGRFGYLGMESIVRDRGFQTLEDAGDIGGDKNSSFGIDDERRTVRRMLEWIDALPKRDRFFMTYLPIAGHHPYPSPEPGPFPTEQAINRYRNALHHADAALAELWSGLQARGLDDQTLLVVYGDHGEAFGQHAGNYAHTLNIYDENVRVPLLFVVPNGGQQPVRVRRVASLIDLAPTVLDLLGLPPPVAYQGRSLLDGPPRMALFFTDYSLCQLGLRDGRWKFIHERETGRSHLFDVVADADETCDLAEQLPERAEAYRQHLLRWTASQRDYVLHRTAHTN
jgi:arylsulfatase A-like enzyme